VADPNDHSVHVFDLEAHTYERRATCSGSDALLEAPVAVAWVGEDLWVCDSKVGALAVFRSSGGGRWIARDVLSRPAGIAFCETNELCYVTDSAEHLVQVFDRSGQHVLTFGTRGTAAGQFNHPSHIDCGRDGRLVVADSLNFRIQQLGSDGSPQGLLGQSGDAAGDLSLPKGVSVDGDGNIWVVDARFENVQAFTPEGQLLMAFGKEGRGKGEFWLPAGMCIDRQGRMWIADTYNRRVQVFEMIR
jgi:sugar lactone lactonase YvrE